jgi:hypothetical protein
MGNLAHQRRIGKGGIGVKAKQKAESRKQKAEMLRPET